MARPTLDYQQFTLRPRRAAPPKARTRATPTEALTHTLTFLATCNTWTTAQTIHLRTGLTPAAVDAALLTIRRAGLSATQRLHGQTQVRLHRTRTEITHARLWAFMQGRAHTPTPAITAYYALDIPLLTVSRALNGWHRSKHLKANLHGFTVAPALTSAPVATLADIAARIHKEHHD
ncbi:hypothetical protein [Deinococcus kurensis]|uniref:hypothetical protein n=1 Tax=Deinococcus kurensis TaxID=2662757 RepID=UPI0012D2B47C|nr:hypothetical protein [Deinococcus kurensis]